MDGEEPLESVSSGSCGTSHLTRRGITVVDGFAKKKTKQKKRLKRVAFFTVLCNEMGRDFEISHYPELQ